MLYPYQTITLSPDVLPVPRAAHVMSVLTLTDTKCWLSISGSEHVDWRYRFGGA